MDSIRAICLLDALVFAGCTLLVNAGEMGEHSSLKKMGKMESVHSYSERLKIPSEILLPIGKDCYIHFVLVPSGSFRTGMHPPSRSFAPYLFLLMVLISFICAVIYCRKKLPGSKLKYTLLELVLLVILIGNIMFCAYSEKTYLAAFSAYRAIEDGNQQIETSIPEPFYISKTELTYRTWVAAGLDLPDPRLHPNRASESLELPMTCNWFEAKELCSVLGRKTGKRIRLPLEGEWEWACRFPNVSDNRGVNVVGSINTFAWCNENTLHTEEVGKKKPNDLGVFDMLGNVEEWCDGINPKSADLVGPNLQQKWQEQDFYCIARGGSFGYPASQCSPFKRSRKSPFERDCIGVRLVMECGINTQPEDDLIKSK